MIRAVAIDTSTWWGGVALVEGEAGSGKPVAHAGLQVSRSHSRHLLPLLEHLLSQADWDRTSIDLYAATRGPGSFTGLRVGLGTVRGLALAAGKPCYGIVTLEAIAAANGPEDRDRIPVMDAGRGEVYAARYSGSSFPPEPRAEPWLGTPGSVSGSGDRPAVFIGPGALQHREELLAGSPGSLVRGLAAVALGAGLLALRQHEDGVSPEPGMSPLYLRPPDAVLKPR